MAANMIPNDKRDYLMRLKKEDITIDLLAKMFSARTSLSMKGKKNAFDLAKPEFNTTWKMYLKDGEYINQKAVETTCGIFMFNKLLVEGDISKCIPNGYCNSIMTAKEFKKFLKYVGTAVRDGVIPVMPTLYNFLRDYEFWAMKGTAIFSASYTRKMVQPSEDLKKAKEKMLDHQKEGSLNDQVETRQKLLSLAEKSTAGDPGRAIFDSGSRGSFENDFGNMFVAVGPVADPATGEYHFIKSNYVTGISKEDLVACGNIIVNAEYPKAVGTSKGGYKTKQFNAVYQTSTLGEEDSDCGTKNGLPIILTKENLHLYTDQYIMDGGKLILITDNIDAKYLNTTVMIRSPMYCLRLPDGDQICAHCAGKRYYKIGIRNMGLTATSVSGQIVNANMKLRHNLTVSVNKIDPKKIIY